MSSNKVRVQLLLSLAVIIALLAVPAGITVPISDALPVASAQPPPGEPGGNHSKPGDNKKKKRDDQRRANNPSRSGSDQSDSRRQQGFQQGTSQRPTSTVGSGREPESRRRVSRRRAARHLSGAVRGRPYRAGNTGFDGYAEEQASWDARERRTGIPIERKKIRVKITDPTNPNGPPIQREYDGLEPIPGQPGKYTGLEHKVGTRRLSGNQRLADGLIRSGIPGRGVLNGKPIEVVAVPDPIRVPTPVPAPAPAPAPSRRTAACGVATCSCRATCGSATSSACAPTCGSASASSTTGRHTDGTVGAGHACAGRSAGGHRYRVGGHVRATTRNRSTGRSWWSGVGLLPSVGC